MPTSIPAPMLAKAVPDVPDPEKVAGGLSYEPKWDGFRGIVSWDGEDVEIGSRGAKPLTRYFPELVEAFARLLPEPCLLDGEVVVPKGEPGAQRLDWESLLAAHPSGGLPRRHARRGDPGDVHRLRPARPRRPRPAGRAVRGAAGAAGRRCSAGLPHPIHVTQDHDGCRRSPRAGSREFEGAGLDGVVAKPLAQPYAPGKRTMFKIKHARTADVVALGLPHPQVGTGRRVAPGRPLHDDGTLHSVGASRRGATRGASSSSTSSRRSSSAMTPARPSRARARSPASRRRTGTRRSCSCGPSACSRCATTSSRATRFRHTVQFERWRPDREPASCTYEQLERSAPTTSATCSTEPPSRCRRRSQFSAFLRLGCTRGGSPGIFGKSGGNGSSPSPFERSRSHHSSSVSIGPARRAAPPTGRPRRRAAAGSSGS